MIGFKYSYKLKLQPRNEKVSTHFQDTLTKDKFVHKRLPSDKRPSETEKKTITRRPRVVMSYMCVRARVCACG